MKVVGYCRFSSEGQKDGYSIEAQTEAIRSYCEINNHTLLRFYIDEAKTGTQDDREGFLDMIDDTKSGEFEAIVVHKLDRFARNRYDSAIYGRILEDRKVRLLSVLEPIIADDSPESLLFRGIVETMNEYYSRNLSRETLKGQRIAARNAQHLGGAVPFGYDLTKDKHYTPNPTEAPIVLEIYTRLDAGQSSIAVARWLNTRGLLTRHHKQFTGSSVLNLVKSPIYIGRYVWGATSKRKGVTPIVVENACEPLVPKDLFDRVNAVISARKTGPVGRNRDVDYLLTGVLYCEYCGRHLYGFKSHAHYTLKSTGEVRDYTVYKYRCSHDNRQSFNRKTDDGYVKEVCPLKMLPKDDIESFVGDAVRSVIFAPDSAAWISGVLQERMKTIMPGNPDAVKKVDANIRATSTKQQRLLDLYLDGGIDKAAYNQKSRELNEQMQYLSAERAKMQTPPPDVSIEAIKSAIAKYSESASVKSVESTKMLIDTFVDHIDVSNEHIVIFFNVEFPFLPECSTFDFVRSGKNALPQFFLRTEFLYTPSISRPPVFVAQMGSSSLVAASEFVRRPA